MFLVQFDELGNKEILSVFFFEESAVSTGAFLVELLLHDKDPTVDARVI